jgi:23S rRNA pseudouridine1911/1915/1917 synthase
MESTRQLAVEDGGQRLDRFLAAGCPELSRSFIQKLIAEGHVLVNGKEARPSLKLKDGDLISVTVPPPQPSQLAAEDIPLDVLYQDDDLIVVNKPAGMTTHPAPGNRSGTLVNALLALLPALPEASSPERPGIVHRLDKDTSGLIVVAKNRRALETLAAQVKSRQVKKTYLALVKGKLKPGQGLIDAPIGRDPSHRQRMAVVSSGRPARTRYRVLKQLPGYSLIAAMPETGRTHQIRVHMAEIGHPIVSDATYGTRSDILPRQFLHAYSLSFLLPSNGRQVAFTAYLPEDMQRALEGIAAGASVIDI